MSDQSAQRFGIWSGKGGDLVKDRTIFRFGKRVESVYVANFSAVNRLIEVQVARDPVFYWPDDIPGPAHGSRQEVSHQTYFYMPVGAYKTEYSPPFFARRGLKIKQVGGGGKQVWADAIVHGVSEGEIQNKDIG